MYGGICGLLRDWYVSFTLWHTWVYYVLSYSGIFSISKITADYVPLNIHISVLSLMCYFMNVGLYSFNYFYSLLLKWILL